MRDLFRGGFWNNAALPRAEPVEASSAHDRLRPLFVYTDNVRGRAPIAAAVLLPNFV